MRCINCGRLGTVNRVEDDFTCAKCGYEWNVAHEAANAAYLAAHGRDPARSIHDAPGIEAAADEVDEVAAILAPVTESGTNDALVMEVALNDLPESSDADGTVIDATRDAGPLDDDEYASLIEALEAKTVAELDDLADEAGVAFRYDDIKTEKIAKLADSGRVYVADDAFIVVPDEGAY